MSKHDKKGPELMIPSEQMLVGLEVLSGQFKKNHSYDTADFLNNVKTALSKYPSLVEDAEKIVSSGREAVKTITMFCDLVELMFPKNTNILEEEKK